MRGDIKLQIEKKTLKNVFLGVAACIILYWLLHETDRVKGVYTFVRNMLSPFIIGSVLAFICNVPVRAIEGKFTFIKKEKLRRLTAVSITSAVIILILALVFWLLIPQLSNTVQVLLPRLYSFVVNAERAITGFLNENPKLMEWVVKYTDFESVDWSGLLQKAVSFLGNGVSAVVGGAFNAIGNIFTTAFNCVIAVVFAVYCLFQKETLARQGRKLLYAFLPESASDQIVRILRLTNATFSNFLSGQCVEVCILGSLFAVTMAIFRMPYIPLVSVLVAVTAFIPIVGAWIGCILGAFLILVNDPAQAFWFVVMFLVLQQFENNVIYPRVVGTSIGLSGMWVLVSVAVGGEIMGVAGMFLMVPISSVLYTLLREVTHKRLNKRDISSEKLCAQPPDIVSHFKKKNLDKKSSLKCKADKKQSEQTKS